MYFREQPPPGVEAPEKPWGLNNATAPMQGLDSGPFASCVFLGPLDRAMAKAKMVTNDHGWTGWHHEMEGSQSSRTWPEETESTAADAREFERLPGTTSYEDDQYGRDEGWSGGNASTKLSSYGGQNSTATLPERRPFNEFETGRLTDRLAFLMEKQGHQTMRDPDCPHILLIVAQSSWLPPFIMQNEIHHGTIYSRCIGGRIVQVDDYNRGTPQDSEDGCTSIKPYTSVIGICARLIGLSPRVVQRRAHSLEVDCRLLQLAEVGDEDNSSIDGFAPILADMIGILRTARQFASRALNEAQASPEAYHLMRCHILGCCCPTSVESGRMGEGELQSAEKSTKVANIIPEAGALWPRPAGGIQGLKVGVPNGISCQSTDICPMNRYPLGRRGWVLDQLVKTFDKTDTTMPQIEALYEAEDDDIIS
ncbi:hypothetical protein FOL47_000948 [Perkinsus chesapeaki]|uniref:Uncharacterized protein n=1 Tax=Perkinsus chesapeaki TaxID=330153 RepID=A0A7J6MM91_PERCH|nr:hypothetical protein FOL47_000948 [Perkinsus chesapeaki]